MTISEANHKPVFVKKKVIGPAVKYERKSLLINVFYDAANTKEFY